MSAPTLPARAVVLSGIGLGIAGDSLLRGVGGPGVNVFLLFAGLGLATWYVSRAAGLRLSLEGTVWIVLGVLCAAGVAFRGSTTLRLLAFLCAAAAFAVPALHAGATWVTRTGVLQLLESLVAAPLFGLVGSVRLLPGAGWLAPTSTSAEVSRGWRLTRLSLGAILLAAPPLLVFGALFISADTIFANLVSEVFRVDLEDLVSHGLVVALLSWLACGYLAGFVTGTRIDSLGAVRPPRPTLGVVEVGTALALVDLLFVSFVVVQFRYLFGGSQLVEVTPGLTYAAYAREGFFQLVVASALVVPWLLGTDWLLRDTHRGPRFAYVSLASLQLLLLLAIVVSALQRMRVYQDVYGMTELRLFATAFLVWVSILVLWFAATVLRGRRTRFVFGTLVGAFGLVASLHLLNPDALVARTNLDRARVGVAPSRVVGPALDVSYLTSLGSDAVPILLEALDDSTESDLSTSGKCRIARRLLRAWGPSVPTDWRSWNWSVARAREMVRVEAPTLRQLAPSRMRCG